VVGYTKRRSKKWVSDQTFQIMTEVTGRKKEMLESGSAESRREFEEARCTLNKCIKEDKERRLARVCEDMEEARKKGDSKKLFAGVNKLCGKNYSQTITLGTVYGKDRKEIQEKDQVLTRWMDHFSELLNRQEPSNTQDTLKEIEMITRSREQANDEMADEVTYEEVRRAVQQMRKGKAPGICNVASEVLQETGPSTIKWLHRVIQAVWKEEKVPDDWTKAVIIRIHKKGDKKVCNNSRGISLLSVPSKVFTRVILNRISNTVNALLRENQCGFRKARGCADQIFLLRQIIEKKLEFTEDLYICFIDFAQAYDSIWRQGTWKLLSQYGCHDKIVRLLRAVYSTVQACVRIEGKESEWFGIETGVRQGCILSPTLLYWTI